MICFLVHSLPVLFSFLCFLQLFVLFHLLRFLCVSCFILVLVWSYIRLPVKFPSCFPALSSCVSPVLIIPLVSRYSYYYQLLLLQLLFSHYSFRVKDTDVDLRHPVFLCLVSGSALCQTVRLCQFFTSGLVLTLQLCVGVLVLLVFSMNLVSCSYLLLCFSCFLSFRNFLKSSSLKPTFSFFFIFVVSCFCCYTIHRTIETS